MTEWLHFHFSLSCIGEGNGNPLWCSCPENPRDGGAWWAALDGVAQSRTRLKQLSSSSSSMTTFTKNIIIYWGLQHFATCNWHCENKKHRKGHHNLHPVTDSQSLTPLAKCSSMTVKNYYFLDKSQKSLMQCLGWVGLQRIVMQLKLAGIRTFFQTWGYCFPSLTLVSGSGK